MPRRHPHCLHASTAFWPVNSHKPQPDHPELGPDPFTQTEYETERIQVPEAKVSIPAVRLPAGVQVWKGIADSVANTHGYIPHTSQTYTPVNHPQFNHGKFNESTETAQAYSAVERTGEDTRGIDLSVITDQTYTPVHHPQFNHSGFYGSSETAQTYSAVERTGEDTPGIDLSFITKHKLKLIDIGDVGTANAIRELINTVTPEKVATDPRYYYFLEMISDALPDTDQVKEVTSIDCDEGAVAEHMQGIPYGDLDAVLFYFASELAPWYFQEDGTEKNPLDCFGITFDTRDSLFRFLMEYKSFKHAKKKYSNDNKDIDDLYQYYTYRRVDAVDIREWPLEKKVTKICDRYFEPDKHERHRENVRQLLQREFSAYVEKTREGLVWALVKSLAHVKVTGLTYPMTMPFSLVSRHSINVYDNILARLLQRFVSKFCYFDGWIYIEDTDAVKTNLNTVSRSLTYDPDTAELEYGLHSEIFLTDQGKAKLDYVGYNRFDT